VKCVVLCGGSGTRLWPISRENHPKQFIKIFDDRSLFQLTVLRNLPLSDKIAVVTGEEQYFLALDQMEEIGRRSDLCIIEPFGKNTAASIAFAAFASDPEEVLFITPSDHLIEDMEAYREAVERAQEGAKEGYLVTFGIEPTRPATGYGYIFARPKDGRLWAVERFVEKPDLERAKEYLAYKGDDGRYFWNSGMFCFKAGVYLAELERYRPDIYEAAKEAYDHARDGGFLRILPKYMEKIPDESVDYAVMEHSRRIAMVPARFRWSDVGDFDALYELFEKDEQGNTKAARYVAHRSKGNFLYGKDRMIALSEVEDLIVVDTPSALLVTRRGAAQSVRDVVKKIKQIDPMLVKFGHTVYRPWGSFTLLEEQEGFKVKKIVVKPGRRLSLQKHLHRSEHWVVVRGTAEVTRGDETFILRPNESTYIPIGVEHRLANPGKVDLEVIEVQVGDYLGEDDIIRIEDDYGRKES